MNRTSKTCTRPVNKYNHDLEPGTLHPKTPYKIPHYFRIKWLLILYIHAVDIFSGVHGKKIVQ